MGFIGFLQNTDNLLHVLPLIFIGVMAVAIIAERARALFMIYPMQNKEGFFQKITELLNTGRTSDAVALCDQFPTKPLSLVVKSALLRAHLPENLVEHGIEMSLSEATQAIKKRTSFLAMLANVATLLGLFGTIAGLIASFQAVGQADPQQKSAILAAGISTAMNATMMGLAIAIPCMVAYSFFMNRTNRLNADLEHSSIRILDILKQRFYGATLGEENWPQPTNGAEKKNGKSTHFGSAA